MFMVSILSWWYGDGWRQRFMMLRESLAKTLDYFSLGLLLKTLFKPFREISAGKVRGPINIQMRALVDQLISRFIGAAVRSIVILIGCLVIILQLVWGMVVLAGWGLIPFLPVIGIGMTTSGWVPSW